MRLYAQVYLDGKRFRCAECAPEQQTVRGCHAPGKTAWAVAVRGQAETRDRCPKSYQSPERDGWLTAHVHWSQGRFWHGPELSRWPARDLAAMEILDHEIGMKRERDAELQKLADRLNAGAGSVHG